jgi:elongation factor G
MGELHLDILVDRMRREFKVEVNQGEPQVEYKSFYKICVHRETYKNNQGRGKFGDIVFKLEPADEVDGKFQRLQFVNAVKVVTFLKNIFHLLKKVLEKL